MDKELLILVFLHDTVANNFGFPVVVDNESTAKRMFIDLVSDKETTVGKHPSDFELYRGGYFNPRTGEIFSKFHKETDIILTGLEAQALGGSDE